jgi:protein-L-isoaspartate(D-aspartate) O-methyltransferase
MADLENARMEMVERQIAARGVLSQRVLDAMRRVPREVFQAGAWLSKSPL